VVGGPFGLEVWDTQSARRLAFHPWKVQALAVGDAEGRPVVLVSHDDGSVAIHDLPSKPRAIWQFLRDFTPRMRYDEFKTYDWKPGVVECASLAATLAEGAGLMLGSVVRSMPRPWARTRKAKGERVTA